MRTVVVVLPETVYHQLDRIAGPESLQGTVETLIVREYRKRERKMLTLVIEDSTLISPSPMP